MLSNDGSRTSGLAVPEIDAAAGQMKDPNMTLREKTGPSNSTEHVSKVARFDSQQESDVASGSASDDVTQCVMPLDNTQATDHSALPHAADSPANAGIAEHEEPDASSAGEAQRAQHAQPCTAHPPWSCVKAACTAQQLKALHQCCCTVACFDIFEQISGKADQTQGNKPNDERHKPGCEEQPQQHQACKARPLWSHPVIAAAYLSAGDGAVAVACSDGMLLLLDQASGNLIRCAPLFAVSLQVPLPEDINTTKPKNSWIACRSMRNGSTAASTQLYQRGCIVVLLDFLLSRCMLSPVFSGQNP